MAIRGKTEKVSVTLPRELASEIRDIVPQGEVSAFFTEALWSYLAFRKQRRALSKGFGLWKGENHPELTAPEDAAAYVRGLRQADAGRRARLEKKLGG